ncbi:MAG TPA: DUF5703 domain-containing protein, partial [Verrucomicrobiae bacterium]
MGKTDAWGENVAADEGLMKVCGVQFTLSPNPLPANGGFQQTLELHEGQITIIEGVAPNYVSLRLWVDANNPVVRAEFTSAGIPRQIRANLLNWRLSGANPDILVGSQTNAIISYHHNRSNADSHVANWTFGAMIQGMGMTNLTPTNLVSVSPVDYQLVNVHPLTTITGTTNQWLTQVQADTAVLSAMNVTDSYSRHTNWWADFWSRSYIFVTGDQAARTTTQGYLWQRYISACAGRGAYPIKFNGSLFVVENPSVPYTQDGRRWGGQYWMQNTREMYWPMLAAGDFEMMLPFFNMYAQIIATNMTTVSQLYGHGGSYSAETSPFWGGLKDESTNAVPMGGSSLFTDRYYEGVLELGMMMLDYYDHTTDTNYLIQTIVPTISAGLTFYDGHFGRDAAGKLSLYPVNALETYWDTYNPAPDIAGLQAVIPRMLALPPATTTPAQRIQWQRLLSELPPLPRGNSGNSPVLWPYSGPQTNTIRNGENTQLYAVFPYRLYGLDKPDLSRAVNSYNTRLFYGLGWA